MQYLSDVWLDAANEALQQSPPPPAGRIVIDQHVERVASWRIVIDESPHIDRHPVDGEADATFRQSLETAQAIASGSTDAHQAFLLGEIRFEGDIEALIEHRDAIAWLHQALAPVIAVTTWT